MIFDPTTLMTLAYIALAVLALVMCLKTQWPLIAKIALIAAVTGLYFVAYSAHEGLMGWPTKERMPERFVLLATVIEEPNKEKSTTGHIYVWVNGLVGNKPLAEPRAYRLPYEKDLHALLGEAMKKNRQGVTQIGRLEAKPGPTGASWMRGAGNDNVTIKMSDLPAAQLPEK
jgi:hypothetical protein